MVVGLAGLVVAIFTLTHVEVYEGFLLLIAYWIGPWLAVVLTDYWLRKGDYGDESIFYDSKYQRWQGVAAMAIGLIVSVGLFANVFSISWKNLSSCVFRISAYASRAVPRQISELHLKVWHPILCLFTTKTDRRTTSPITSLLLSIQTGKCVDGEQKISNWSSIRYHREPTGCKLSLS